MTTDHRYDAFLSYKSSSSGRAARRLVRHLLTIAKRHRGEREPRLFYDQFTMPPGRLRAGLLDAVRRSRHLLVLIDEEVSESEWVATEIRAWQDAGGNPDRLLLIRTSTAVDLTWSDGGFRNPAQLPEPLRDYFPAEQAWIDYPAWALTRSDDRLARLCATLIGTDPRDYLVAESEIQRRRNRRTTAIAAALAVLAVASVFFGIRSAVSERAATRSATEAFAQADAAEALLAAADAPTLAIERAVRAARRSDSPTVRSAMLAVSQQTRRLRRAVTYPEAAAGHPAARAAFSADGSRLVAWGDGPRAATSYLQIWDVASGRAEVSAPVALAGMTEVVRVNSQFAVACAEGGPVRLALPGAGLTALGGADGSCALHPFEGGVVVQTTGTAIHVDRRGRAARVQNVSTVVAEPRSRYALAAGRSGSHVLRGGRWVRVAAVPAQARYADRNGRFLSRLGPAAWQFVEQAGAAPRARVVPVPPSAVDVAPVTDYGRFTGQVIWVDDRGTVGWSGGRTTTRVGNEEGEPGWTPFSTRLAALYHGDAVVVFRNTATVVRTPRAGMTVAEAADGWQPGAAPGWAQRVVQHRLGSPAGPDADPIAGRCRDGSAVFVRTDLPEGGTLKVHTDARPVELSGPPLLAGDCTAVTAGTGLDVLAASRVRLRDRPAAGPVVVSPDGDQVAIVQPGTPVQILSTVEEASLPRPWNVDTGADGWPAAGGARLVRQALDGLTFVADGAAPVTVAVPGMRAVAAVRPDGRGAAVTTPAGLALVQDTSVRPAACRGVGVEYVPEPGFRESAAAAGAQIPAARRDDGAAIDCRTGRELPRPAERVLQYDVAPATAVLVTATGTATTIVRWRPDRRAAPDVRDGPALPGPDARLVVAERAGAAAIYTPGGRHVTLLRPAGDRWTSTVEIVPALPQVASAVLADGGTLLLVAGSQGGFELYDTVAGRLLASDPAVNLNAGATVGEAAAFRRGDDLFLYLFDAGFAGTHAVVQIPIGVPALLAQLCGLYQAPACPA